jgi:CubicO group peptidase (beta-lactamase class C family)
MPLMLLLALQAGADDRAVDASVRQAMRQWRVPGCAVVVVRDDRVIYCKGHGLQVEGSDRAVSADTLFPLSSCSKAFTTAAMALLVEEGKLGWDDPVRKHLPWFRLSDELVEDEVTLRDLLCHRTGLGPHELLWHRAPWSPEEAVRRLRHLPMARPFRTALQYQSTAVAAAGLAAAKAAGTSWSDLVRKRLLTPLGMKSTRTSYAEALKSEHLATGHRDGAALPRLDSEHADPAISVYSSARDLGAWLRFQLAQGKPLLKRQLRETHTPQMVIRLSPAQQTVFPDTTQMSYALGWAVHDYRGLKLVSHGGAIDGFRAHLTFAPEKRLGIAVLCNLDRTPMPLALASTLLDQQLGLPRRDWHALHRKLHDDLTARAQRGPARRQGTKPSRELAAYVGDYAHPAYGAVRIGLARGKLVWRWRDEEVALEHFHHDTYALSSEIVHDAKVTFSLSAAGEVEGLSVTGRLGATFRRSKR